MVTLYTQELEDWGLHIDEDITVFEQVVEYFAQIIIQGRVKRKFPFHSIRVRQMKKVFELRDKFNDISKEYPAPTGTIY